MKKWFSRNDNTVETKDLVIIEQLSKFDLINIDKYEISNPHYINQIIQVFPQVKELVNNQKKFLNKKEDIELVFKIDIPVDKLINVKGDPKKFRAIQAGEGGRFLKHAKLTPVETGKDKIPKDLVIKNVMEIASLVVQQYYLSEIDTKLINLVESLQNIENFHKDEFQGRIRSLIINISYLNKFSDEFSSRKETAQMKQVELGRYRLQATDLLEQINLSLGREVNTDQIIDFETYQKITKRISDNLFYQKILLQLLGEVVRLEFVFNDGHLTIDSCYDIHSHYVSEFNRISRDIEKFHREKIELFGIDLKKGTRKQEGAMKIFADVVKEVKNGAPKGAVGVLISPIGVALGTVANEIDKQVSEVSINKQQLNMISTHLDLRYEEIAFELDNYNKDVQLLVEDGKLYYLPN